MHQVFNHRYDENGNHKLDHIKNGVVYEGNWTPYTQPARNGEYLIYTEYWNGVFIPEVPYQLTQLTDFTINHQ